MKKILLSILCAFSCLFGMAQSEKTYTEHYVVKTNGVVTNEADADVTIVDNGNGTINFVLKEFTVTIGNEPTNVGDISLEGVPVTEGEDGLKHFTDEGRTFTIPAEKLPADFRPYAFAFQNIPYTLQGKLNDTKLYATINIDMSTLGQSISVEVGTDDFPTPVGKAYTEPLIVTINGNSSEPQDANVIVQDNGDGTINFVLKNFILVIGEEEMAVGNICVENIAVEEGDDGLKHFAYNGGTVLQEGDLEGVEWMGPFINTLCGGEVPLDLRGKMNDDKLYVTIDIDLQSIMQQIVYVQLGTDDFPPAGVLGDANGDGEVDIADVTYILGVMASGGKEAVADINGDGDVDIADVTNVLTIMANQ